MADNFDQTIPHIFISYAHNDNVVPRQWVDEFAKRLKEYVDVRWGGDAKVWTDSREVQGNDALQRKILAAVKRAYVIVSVISPSYFNSPWSLTELRTFYEAAKVDAEVDVTLRVFKVYKLSVEPIAAKTIPELVDTMGFAFYTKGERKDVTIDPSHANDVFNNAIDDVAIPVSQVLTKLLGGENRLSRMTGIRIYLGRAGSDLAEQRYALRIALLLAGHSVIETDLVYDGTYEKRVRAQLAGCHMSIHPIGDNYARLENSDLPVDRPAYDLANEEAKRRPEFRRISWRPVRTLPGNEAQARFIEVVRDDVTLGNMEHIEEELVYFKETLNDRLAVIAEHMGPGGLKPRAPARVSAKTVYLLYDPRFDGVEGTASAAAITAIRDYLIEQKFNVAKPLTERSPQDIADFHRRALRKCDGVLVYYGDASPLWIADAVDDLHDTAKGRGFDAGGYDECAVLLAPQMTPAKRDFNDFDVRRLVLTDPFDPAVLANFIAKLRAAVQPR
ncbi:MAG: hypothetical protein JWM87_3511 [Candidatus Eremiobacteraeota bacterium]|nr:hypothetical protein [Candidatus Eremiobacteraeota bacterium]